MSRVIVSSAVAECGPDISGMRNFRCVLCTKSGASYAREWLTDKGVPTLTQMRQSFEAFPWIWKELTAPKILIP